jgi:hypothetical protein
MDSTVPVVIGALYEPVAPSPRVEVEQRDAHPRLTS